MSFMNGLSTPLIWESWAPRNNDGERDNDWPQRGGGIQADDRRSEFSMNRRTMPPSPPSFDDAGRSMLSMNSDNYQRDMRPGRNSGTSAFGNRNAAPLLPLPPPLPLLDQSMMDYARGSDDLSSNFLLPDPSPEMMQPQFAGVGNRQQQRGQQRPNQIQNQFRNNQQNRAQRFQTQQNNQYDDQPTNNRQFGQSQFFGYQQQQNHFFSNQSQQNRKFGQSQQNRQQQNKRNQQQQQNRQQYRQQQNKQQNQQKKNKQWKHNLQQQQQMPSQSQNQSGQPQGKQMTYKNKRQMARQVPYNPNSKQRAGKSKGMQGNKNQILPMMSIKGLFFCTTCNTSFSAQADLQDHLKSDRHKQKKQLLQATLSNRPKQEQASASLSAQTPSTQTTLDASDSGFCVLCKVNFVGSIVQHRQTKEHKDKKAEARPFCALCGNFFKNPAKFVKHCNSEHHQRKRQQAEAKQAALEAVNSSGDQDDPLAMEGTVPSQEDGAGNPEMEMDTQENLNFKEQVVVQKAEKHGQEETKDELNTVIEDGKNENRNSVVENEKVEAEAIEPKSDKLGQAKKETPEEIKELSGEESCKVVLNTIDYETIPEGKGGRSLPTDSHSSSECPSSSNVNSKHSTKLRRSVGRSYIIPVSGYCCKLCRKFLRNERTAMIEHCQSKEHIRKYESAIISGKMNFSEADELKCDDDYMQEKEMSTVSCKEDVEENEIVPVSCDDDAEEKGMAADPNNEDEGTDLELLDETQLRCAQGDDINDIN